MSELEAISKRLVQVIWQRYRVKFHWTFLADLLPLIPPSERIRNTAEALQYGRRLLGGACDEALQTFYEHARTWRKVVDRLNDEKPAN